MASSHELGEDDQKHQREQIIEKQHRLLPQSESNITANECKVRFQSRNRLPVISMNTSSRVGCFRLTSTNSSPCWSIHLINSTKVAAGRRDTTVSVRPEESVWVFTVSGHCGWSLGISLLQVITMDDAALLCCCRLRGVSSAMIFPWSMMATRSHSRSASSI